MKHAEVDYWVKSLHTACATQRKPGNCSQFQEIKTRKVKLLWHSFSSSSALCRFLFFPRDLPFLLAMPRSFVVDAVCMLLMPLLLGWGDCRQDIDRSRSEIHLTQLSEDKFPDLRIATKPDTGKNYDHCKTTCTLLAFTAGRKQFWPPTSRGLTSMIDACGAVNAGKISFSWARAMHACIFLRFSFHLPKKKHHHKRL